MSAAQVLEQARALGISLSGSGGKLRYEAPAGRLTPERSPGRAQGRDPGYAGG
ncbi:MAG: hypothetical protein ACREUD_03270 [Gammaproteobacteria bacterium]